MTPSIQPIPEKKPSFFSALLFSSKSSLHKIKRGIENKSNKISRFPKSRLMENFSVLSESVSPLWSNDNEQNKILTTGKVQNLRVASRKLNSIEIPAGEVFSFWKQVGKPSLLRGFVNGRELREGCIIPSIGGGLCQLSNALYDAALKAGFEIIERHKHSHVIPGSLAEQDRDATVFWNYIDLRFRSKNAFRIEIEMNDSKLMVRFRGKAIVKNSFSENLNSFPSKNLKQTTINDCLSCGVTSCFRNVKKTSKEKNSTAWLLDEKWPEFENYFGENVSAGDTVLTPMNGERFGQKQYSWNATVPTIKKFATISTLRRSFELRKKPRQGNLLQSTLQKASEDLANVYGRKINYKTKHLVISQPLLPFLHLNYATAGRTYDVFMTRLPLFLLQEKLDKAVSLHPQSKTLSDFRATEELVKAERDALNNAQHIITTHPQIAALYPAKTILLEWKKPMPFLNKRNGKDILFPASALGRKGAYELRDACKKLGLSLSIMGKATEFEGFWGAIQTKKFDDDWNKIGLVVLPAFIEHQPRILLKALSRGIPVIASSACGLGNMNGVTTIEAGNTFELIEALQFHLQTEKESELRKVI
jgi:hypothetical protein